MRRILLLLNRIALFCVLSVILISCSSDYLRTDAVHYQSIRKMYRYGDKDSASIGVAVEVDGSSKDISITIWNMTDEVMTIDMTRSFFISTDGEFTSFYDPTVRVESTSESESSHGGAIINAGAVAGAFGIGGVVGQTLNGVSVGGGSSSGTVTTNSRYFVEMPQINLPSHISGTLPKNFKEHYIGYCYTSDTYIEQKMEDAKWFGIVISYSTDGGRTFIKYEQKYYFNASFHVPVEQHGQVNTALRKVLETKTDCVHEPWWMFYEFSGINENFYFGDNYKSSSNFFSERKSLFFSNTLSEVDYQ